MIRPCSLVRLAPPHAYLHWLLQAMLLACMPVKPGVVQAFRHCWWSVLGSELPVMMQVKPLLENIGQGVLDCGDAVRAANVMKLVRTRLPPMRDSSHEKREANEEALDILRGDLPAPLGTINAGRQQALVCLHGRPPCGASSGSAFCPPLQVGNFFIISFNELIAEGMTLGEKSGISRAHTAAFLEKFFPGPFTKGAQQRWPGCQQGFACRMQPSKNRHSLACHDTISPAQRTQYVGLRLTPCIAAIVCREFDEVLGVRVWKSHGIRHAREKFFQLWVLLSCRLPLCV